MDKSVESNIISAEASIVKDARAGNVNQSALNHLYQAAYQQVPDGGFPHLRDEFTSYSDQSTIHSMIHNGVETIIVDEKNKQANCGDIRDKNNNQDLQEIYECMSAVHGSAVVQRVHFDDGHGLTLNSSDSGLVVGGHYLWQKQSASNSTLKVDKDLTLTSGQNGDAGTMVVIGRLPDGQTEKMIMSRPRWYEANDPVKLSSLEISDSTGKTTFVKSFK